MKWKLGFNSMLLSAVFLFTGCSDKEEAAATPWGAESVPEQWYMSVVHVGAERYIVGGNPSEGLMLHDSGDGALVPVELPSPSGLLNWVHAFPDGTLVTVGYEGALFFKRPGGDWTRKNVDTAQQLWGVWGASPDDVWAVGGNGFSEGDAVLFHGSLEDLQPMEIELTRPNVNAWFKVWGSSANDVFIVGQKGAILRWNGSELKEEGAGLSDDLIGIWGTGPDRVAVVGGRNNGVAALWDGTEWRGLELSPVTGLNGVWMRGDTLHAVGVDDGKVLRMSFATGLLLEEEDFLGINLEEARGVDLHAIHGSDDGTVTSVGGNFVLQAGPYSGAVVSRGLGSGE